MSSEHDHLYKLAVIGDSAVGKTNIISRFVDNEFRLDSKSTIGVEFGHIDVNIDSKIIKLQIWDTAGQERYRAIVNAYYRGALGVLMVYDITNKKSFDNIGKWLDQVYQYCNCDPNNKKDERGCTCVILIGNKCDLSTMRQVTTEQGRQYAEKNNMLFLETSALNSTNIEKAFMTIAQEILLKNSDVIENDDNDRNNNIVHPGTPIDNNQKNAQKQNTNSNCKC